jgi:hypothetical protein
MSAFPLFSGHGPRASTEVTFTPGGARASTELEQYPSELIGNCYGLAGIDKEVFLEKPVYQGRSIKWMTNENHQKRGNGPLKACARRLLRKTGHDLAKGADRFEERSKSSDGKSAKEKQKG